MPFWKGSEKVRNSLKEQGQQNLMTSERRRMELQSDLLTFQRDQRLNRAVRLQWRWQELSERERRAQQQNRQLLQEFDRAQDTLRDMVARTAAMNTIRVEYERYLDENYPRWQQELKEQTLSAQRKRMEQHLQESIRRMEEKSVTGSPICAHAPLSHDSSAQVPQTQNGQQNCSSHSALSSWLTHTRYPLASPHTMLSFDPKITQVSHHTPESFAPPPHFHPFHPPQPFQYYKPSSFPIHPQTVTQQGSTMWAPQGEYPLDWTGRVSYFPSNTQFGYQSSMAEPSMSDPQGRAVGEGVRVEKEVKEGLPVARNEGESSYGQRPSGNDQSHELDIQPVRLSSGHGESSDCSRASGRASGESDRRTRRKEKKEGRVKPSSADREDTCLSSGRSVVGPDAEASACATSEAHSSEGDDAMSGGASTRSQRTAGLSAKEPKRRREKAKRKEEDTGSPVEEPQSQIEESPVESPSPVRESESHREESLNLGGESGSVSVKVPGSEEEVEGTEGEQESLGEEGEGEEEAEEEEAGQGAKDEKEEDEEASAGRESAEEEEEADQEAEELSNEADHEEERESDDSLILSKEHRPAENQLILAEEEEAMAGDDNPGDDDHGDDGDGDDDHSDDGHDDDGHGEDARLEKGYSWSGDPTNAVQDEHDEIESLLAPRVETEKKLEKEQIDNKSKAKAGYLNSSSEEENLKENTMASPAAQNTESDDEFDHFYD